MINNIIHNHCQDFSFDGISSSIAENNIIGKCKNIPSNSCKLKKLYNFVVAKVMLRAIESPVIKGHFLCLLEYDGGFLSFPETGSPEQGLSRRKMPPFIIWYYAKNLLKMKNSFAQGTSPAIPAKSITDSYLPTGDPKIPRRELYCSNPSYQQSRNNFKNYHNE